MLTRRKLLVESLPFAGLCAAAAAMLTGCGGEPASPSGTTTNKSTPEQDAETKNALEARERFDKEKKAPKK